MEKRNWLQVIWCSSHYARMAPGPWTGEQSGCQYALTSSCYSDGGDSVVLNQVLSFPLAFPLISKIFFPSQQYSLFPCSKGIFFYGQCHPSFVEWREIKAVNYWFWKFTWGKYKVFLLSLGMAVRALPQLLRRAQLMQSGLLHLPQLWVTAMAQCTSTEN